MKIRVQFKDPDVVHEAIREAVAESYPESMSDEEKEAAAEVRIGEITDITNTWIKYGEYVLIEFDTDAKTATVIPQ